MMAVMLVDVELPHACMSKTIMVRCIKQSIIIIEHTGTQLSQVWRIVAVDNAYELKGHHCFCTQAVDEGSSSWKLCNPYYLVWAHSGLMITEIYRHQL
jgi:hypothetical protein